MNSDLYNNTYPVPDYLIQILTNNLSKYPNTAKGYQRVNNIVDSPELTYSNLKKILSDLENYNPLKNSKEEFEIVGGLKMRDWCKKMLNSDRKGVVNSKKAHSELTTQDNVFRKSHEKNPTNNSLPMYKSELMESKNKKRIIAEELKSLIIKIVKESTEGNQIKLEKEASIGIILNKNNEILILMRSETDDWMPNKWSLPGGNIEDGESPEVAFIREVKEETGLTITKTKHLFNKLEGNYNIYFMISLLEDENQEVKISYEHSDYQWVSLPELRKIDTVPNLFNDVVSSYLNV